MAQILCEKKEREQLLFCKAECGFTMMVIAADLVFKKLLHSFMKQDG